jgi:hypothetical protein
MELRTETVNTIFNSPNSNWQPGGGPFKMEIPQSSVMISRPLSYEFRVVEAVDHDDKIAKVSLQTRVWEHSNYGNGTVIQDWTDVPRIKVPYVATVG